MRSKWEGVNKAKARARPGDLNKTEQRRARVLETQRLAGEIQGWTSQSVSLSLAKGTWYRPDFLVVSGDGHVVFEEVKGRRGWKLDPQGRVKFKAAAGLYPFFAFRGVLAAPGGGWHIEDVEPASQWPPVMPA